MPKDLKVKYMKIMKNQNRNYVSENYNNRLKKLQNCDDDSPLQMAIARLQVEEGEGGTNNEKVAFSLQVTIFELGVISVKSQSIILDFKRRGIILSEVKWVNFLVPSLLT